MYSILITVINYNKFSSGILITVINYNKFSSDYTEKVQLL